MKLNQVDALGLSAGTLEAMEVDATALVVQDEFRRRCPPGDRSNYCERAISRLVGLEIPWYTEHNIQHETIKQFVNITCPRCLMAMKASGGGGSGNTAYVRYRCSCGNQATLAVPAESALAFDPSDCTSDVKAA